MTTVREIIEQLQKFPPDTLFLVDNYEYGVHGDDDDDPIKVFAGTYDTVEYAYGCITVTHAINHDGEGKVVSRQNCAYIYGG